MRVRPWLLILPIAFALFGQAPNTRALTDFMGYNVRLVSPRLNKFGIAEDDAKLCLDRGGRSQCFSFPNTDKPVRVPIGVSPEVNLINLSRPGPALFFSATQYAGGSGGTVHMSLLRPSDGKGLDDFLLSDIKLSMQSEHAFWSESTISPAPIFVTADYVWGPGEAHAGDHRYIISAYALLPEPIVDPEAMRYALDDRYMTATTYTGRGKLEILTAEKPVILARLRRVNAERQRERKK